jgi:uncharacterized protein (TIRG00374 family)
VLLNSKQAPANQLQALGLFLPTLVFFKMIEHKSKNERLLLAAKLLITLALSGIILWNVDWKAIPDAIENSDPILIFIVFVGMGLNILASTLKWNILLSIHGIQYKFSELSKYYFIGAFFNNFLPTNIGGDGYRIYKTIKNPRSKDGAVIAILMERISGILALILLGFICGTIDFLLTGDEIFKLVVIVGAAGFGAAILFYVVLSLNANFARHLISKYLPDRLKKVVEHFGDYRRNPSKTILVIELSILFQLFMLSYRLLLIYAVGASLSIYDMAIVMAVTLIVSLAPISINGLGVVDGSFIYLLVKFGVAYEQAVIVMLLIRILQIPLSLIGGIFYFFDKKSLKIEDYKKQEVQTI